MSLRDGLRTLSPDELVRLARALGVTEDLSPNRMIDELMLRLQSDPHARRHVLAFLQSFPEREGGDRDSDHDGECASSGESRLSELQGERDRLQCQLSDLRAELADARAELERACEAQAEARARAGRAGESLGEERKRRERIEKELESARRKNSLLLEQNGELEKLVTTLRRGTEESGRRQADLQDEVVRLQSQLNELQAEVRRLRRRDTDDHRRTVARQNEMVRQVEALERRYERLRHEVPQGASHTARFVRTPEGGAIVAPGHEVIVVSEAIAKRLRLVHDGLVVVMHAGEGVKDRFIPIDRRSRRQIFGELGEDEQKQVVLVTPHGTIPVVGPCGPVGSMVSAVTLDENDPPTAVQIDAVLDYEDAGSLIATGKPPRRSRRRRRRSKSRRAGRSVARVHDSRPASCGHVLIVGGDRVGSGYVDGLAARGITAEWVSGFGGLASRRSGLRGAKLVVLITSQVSHTLARAVSCAAKDAGVRLEKIHGRGVGGVVSLVERILSEISPPVVDGA